MSPRCARPPEYQGAFPAQAGSVGRLRNAVAEAARACGLDEDGLAALRHAVSEVATNAIMHGYRNRGEPGDEIRAQVFFAEDELLVVIADDGPGVAPRVESPGLGLGMPIVAALTQRFELVSPEHGGTEAHLVFALPRVP